MQVGVPLVLAVFTMPRYTLGEGPGCRSDAGVSPRTPQCITQCITQEPGHMVGLDGGALQLRALSWKADTCEHGPELENKKLLVGGHNNHMQRQIGRKEER